MRYFIDHNDTAVAIAYLGFLESTKDILNVASTSIPEVETMRHIIREVDNGRATLVFSDTCLETLRRILVRGGSDFEAIDEESALDAVNLLRVLAQASGGYVTDEQVKAIRPEARSLVDSHFGSTYGQVDFEDVTVVATILAALAGDEDAYAVLVTEDRGLYNCADALQRRNVAVLGSSRYTRAVKAA